MLVVPARHSASISVKLLQELGGATVIGPILSGVHKPIQICSTVATVNDILNMAVIAACNIDWRAGAGLKPGLPPCPVGWVSNPPCTGPIAWHRASNPASLCA